MKPPSFKNEMLELDGIIRKDIIRFLHDRYPLTPVLYQGFNEELGESIKEIKKRIFAGAQRYSEASNQRGYVLFHQQVLIELAGKLAHHAAYECAPGTEKYMESKALLHSLYEALEDLLSFINTFFAGALPADHWLSVDYYFLVAQEVNEGLDVLQDNFQTLTLSQDLVNIAFAPLLKFVHRHTDNDLTYRRQMFIKKLKSELSRLYELRGKAITDKDVHQLLFTLNFNSLAYLTFVGQAVRRRIEELPTVEEKIDALRVIQRDVSQTVQFPDVIFDTQNPLLKPHTMEWLHEEIQYWQNVHNIPLNVPAPVSPVASPANAHLIYKGVPPKKPGRLKTKVSLAVKQIAFVLRVFSRNRSY